MSKKILIVDDERIITETLAGMLRHRGYEVMEALDGESAIKFIQEQTPELVLLDMKLPGIDGLEVLKTIRRDYPNVFVVVMTGYDVEYKRKVEQIGSDGFFVKPILVNVLKEKIEELFSKERPTVAIVKEMPAPLEKVSEVPPEAIPEEKIVPKANILLIEPRQMLAGLLKDYISRREYSEGDYEINWTSVTEGLRHIDAIRYFQPDIILFDVALVGIFGEFAITLMNLPNPPKEIILFGDPATKWEDADTLIKRGLLYIPTPLDPQYKLPHKDILDRLVQSLKSACIKHGLFRIKGEKRKDEPKDTGFSS
jgi:two-component system response regulator (stage 0 sporulation protein F)